MPDKDYFNLRNRMCGIAGFYSSEITIDEGTLQKMCASLKHRGPDASGIYIKEGGYTGLAHSRLSIIDLSEAANQPMHSHCRRYVMVYN
ncbi:MAG: hypothetical protein NZ522_03665, partial [Chitinophagales bacterium]|nr:hypothetical protein [Chitinophagales bacterium]